MTMPNHDLNLTSQNEPNAIVDGSLPLALRAARHRNHANRAQQLRKIFL
jgi:hypothetical protein